MPGQQNLILTWPDIWFEEFGDVVTTVVVKIAGKLMAKASPGWDSRNNKSLVFYYLCMKILLAVTEMKRFH